jgi:hypothetical protein
MIFLTFLSLASSNDKESHLIVHVRTNVQVFLEFETGQFIFLDPRPVQPTKPMSEIGQEVTGYHQHIRRHSHPVYWLVDDIFE